MTIKEKTVAKDEETEKRDTIRAAAFKAEVLRLLRDDPEIQAAITELKGLEERLKGLVRIYDLKPDAFRRPIPGIHVR